MAEVSDGFVVIAGGYSDKDSTPDFLVYSIIDDTWRTIETETTIHDMVRTDAGVLFALGGRADRGFELFTVDPSEGNVQRVPFPAIPGSGVSSAGIATTAGGGITVATSDGDTTTVVSAGPELKFDAPREVGSAFFHPPVDLVQAPLYPGQMREISSGLLVSVSNRGISAFRAEDGEAAYDSLLDLAGYCGNGGSVVITEAQILTWGGQTCTGEGGGTTNRGVRTVVG